MNIGSVLLAIISFLIVAAGLFILFVLFFKNPFDKQEDFTKEESSFFTFLQFMTLFFGMSVLEKGWELFNSLFTK